MAKQWQHGEQFTLVQWENGDVVVHKGEQPLMAVQFWNPLTEALQLSPATKKALTLLLWDSLSDDHRNLPAGNPEMGAPELTVTLQLRNLLGPKHVQQAEAFNLLMNAVYEALGKIDVEFSCLVTTHAAEGPEMREAEPKPECPHCLPEANDA